MDSNTSTQVRVSQQGKEATTTDVQAPQVDDPRAPNTPWLLPYITVQDAERSIDFYRDALGFELINAMRHGGDNVLHAEMRYQDQMLMFAPEGAFGGKTKTPANSEIASPVTFYLYVQNVDAAYERALAHGATSLQEPTDAFWGDRHALINDPDGYTWSLASYIGHLDLSKVPPIA